MSALRARSTRVALTVGYGVILVAACVAVIAGASMFLLLGVVGVPALLVVRSRLSLGCALALLFVTFVWFTLVVFVLAYYTKASPLVLIVVAASATGALCGWRLYLHPPAWTRADSADLLFASAGGIMWVGVLAAAAVVPGGSPVSWAMSGDAANNVLFARSLMESGGVALGAGQNPVPLTSTLIALFTLPGALLGVPDAGMQILAMAQMWTFGIVAACVMSGAFALSLIRRRSALGLLAVGVTSLVPLCWILLSGPILLGFVNFHLTLALLLVPLIVVVRMTPAILTSFVAISLSLAATLALWAPTAGIPGVALLILCLSRWRELWRLRGARLAVALIAAAQPAAFFLLQSVPSLRGGGEALQDAIGAVYEFRKVVFVALVVVAILLAALFARTIRVLTVVWVLVAILGGGGACLAVLLWIRRHEASVWSYYQLKLLWFLIAVLLVFVVAVGFALAAEAVARPARSAAALLTTITAVWVIGAYAQLTLPTFSHDAQAVADPLGRILTGDFFSVGEDDRVFHRVVELTDSDESTVLWLSTDPDEDSIMFWVVQMSARNIDDVDLRKYAYYHDHSSMDDLCTIRRLMGPPVTVVTHDPDVAARVQTACPDLGPVRVE